MELEEIKLRQDGNLLLAVSESLWLQESHQDISACFEARWLSVKQEVSFQVCSIW